MTNQYVQSRDGCEAVVGQGNFSVQKAMKLFEVDGRYSSDLDLEHWWKAGWVGILGNVAGECDLVVVGVVVVIVIV